MMKKKSLFGKTTALVISSVVLFASPASAQEFRVNNVGLPTIPGLPNMSGGIIVTPDNPDEPISLEDRIALSQAVSQAYTSLGDVLAIAIANAI